MKISNKWLLAMVLPAGLLLSSCASIGLQGAAAEPSSEPEVASEAKPAHHSEPGTVQVTPEQCKAMKKKMHDKMKSGDMDMAAMKKKMMSGEGMSDEQKQCHKMMHKKHKKMHSDKKHGDMKHKDGMKKHKMSASDGSPMPENCKVMMKEMHEKMKQKHEKMQSGENKKHGEMIADTMKKKHAKKHMSEEQKQCHKMMHEKHKKMHKDKKHQAPASEEVATESAPAHQH